MPRHRGNREGDSQKNMILQPQPSKFRSSFFHSWRVEGLGFVFFMAFFFAPLEDALAYGALGNLPGAPTADLTKSPPTSLAAAPSNNLL